jgi:hypothetical protein
MRHGVAATFPVIINDLLIRALYTLKRHYADDVSWSHAAATSWGSWVKFFSDLNLAAWARFGLQGANELEMLANRETANLLLTSEEISVEWDKLLERSAGLLK